MKHDFSNCDPRVLIRISASEDRAPIFIVPPLLYVCDYYIAHNGLSLRDTLDPGELQEEVSRYTFSEEDIRRDLQPVCRSIGDKKGAEFRDTKKFSKYLTEWNKERAEATALTATILYQTAPQLFRDQSDYDLLAMLDSEKGKKKVVADIEKMLNVACRLTLPARRQVPATIPLKEFEFQQLVLHHLRHHRLRLQIKLCENQGLLIRSQKNIHDQLWHGFWFRNFLKFALRTIRLDEDLKELQYDDLNNYIATFWSEYFYPSIDPTGVYSHPSDNLVIRLVFYILIPFYSQTLTRARRIIADAASADSQGKDCLTSLEKNAEQAKKIGEKDLLKLRMHRDVSRMLGIPPIEALPGFESQLSPAKPVTDEAPKSSDTIIEKTEGPSTFGSQVPTITEEYDEFDDLVTMVEQRAEKPEPVIADKAPENVQIENPNEGIEQSTIRQLGTVLEQVNLNTEHDFEVGSYIQFGLNYQDCYYTIEKTAPGQIRMWTEKSPYAVQGNISKIIELNDDSLGRIELGLPLRLLTDEPDPALQAKRWPNEGNPPYFISLRRISRAEFKEAREGTNKSDSAQLPRVFLLSRNVFHFLISDERIVLSMKADVWKFTRPEAEKSISIGRMPNNDVYLHGVPGISRRHSAVVFEKGIWYLVDIGSTNGTYYNGQMLGQGKRERKHWVPLPIGVSGSSENGPQITEDDDLDDEGSTTTMSTMARAMMG